MQKKTIRIINKTGLHARPATQVAALSKSFGSDIWADCNGKRVNFKSIVSILAAGMKQGTLIELNTEGEDEIEAIDALETLITSLTE